MTKPISWYAERYASKYNFYLVPIKPESKLPLLNDWGNNGITDPKAALDYYTQNANHNLGLELGQSRMCSLDIDCIKSFEIIMKEFGLDLEELYSYPTIKGASKGKRIMFRVPDDLELTYQKLNWFSESDPDGSIHRTMMRDAKQAKDLGEIDRESRIREDAKQFAKYTVFELRVGGDRQRYDVLPPSIHPDTGKPYVWEVQPPKSGEWPTPPPWLLTVWQAWESLGQQFKDSCPWTVEPVPVQRAAQAPRREREAGSVDVIGEYIKATPLDGQLERYGYKRVGKRFLSPHSSTGLVGVIMFPAGDTCWIHHASDPLCSDETGQPVNSFDLYREYEHMGDMTAAVREAAKELGIKPTLPAPRYTAPPMEAPQQMPPESNDHQPPVDMPHVNFDQDTGEILHNDFDPFVFLGGEAVEAPAMEPMNAPAEQEDGCVDFVTPLPWANDKGVPLNHHENLKEICRRLGVVIRYNVIRKEEEIVIPNQGFSMDNAANASLALLTSNCSLFKYPTGKVQEFVTLLADQNQHNPVVNWISAKPWDGVPRLVDLMNTVSVEGDGKLKDILIKRWMLSAIAGAYSPKGVSAHGVLVMQGAQNLGKTSWFKSLVPEGLGLTKDGMLLRPDDKDSVKQVVSHWLVELGELDATFRKSDIAALKSFITNDKDILRQPFAKKASEFARRTVFFGSVNPKEYLHDTSGNRRYWTIEAIELNARHGLDMQQVWAEVYDMWKSGEEHYLLADELALLNDHNENFQTADPIDERIRSKLDWDSKPAHWVWMTITQILNEVGMDKPTKTDLTTGGVVVKKLNGDKTDRTAKGRLLLVPKIKF